MDHGTSIGRHIALKENCSVFWDKVEVPREIFKTKIDCLCTVGNYRLYVQCYPSYPKFPPRIWSSISNHIPILRAQVSQLRLLILTQPAASEAHLIPSLIRPQHSYQIRETTRRAQTDKADTDTIPRLIHWRILLQKSVRRNYPSDIPKPNLPSRADGAAMVTT